MRKKTTIIKRIVSKNFLRALLGLVIEGLVTLLPHATQQLYDENGRFVKTTKYGY